MYPANLLFQKANVLCIVIKERKACGTNVSGTYVPETPGCEETVASVVKCELQKQGGGRK